MGFLNEIKKVLFAAKAVSKSAAENAAETVKDKAAQAYDSVKEVAGETFDKAKEVAEKAADKARDLAGDAIETVKETAETVQEKVGNLVDTTPEAPVAAPVVEKATPLAATVETPVVEENKESILDKAGNIAAQAGTTLAGAGAVAMDKASEVGEKASAAAERAGEFVSGVGEKVLDKATDIGEKAFDAAGKAGEKLMDVSEKVGEQVKDLAGNIWERAKVAGGGLMDKANDLVERANTEAAKEGDMESTLERATRISEELAQKAEESAKTPFFEKVKEDGGSLLDGKDSFFEKAKRFADGDYSMKGEGSEPVEKLDLKPLPPKPASESNTTEGGTES